MLHADVTFGTEGTHAGKKGVIADLFYLPNLEFFCLLKGADSITFVLEDPFVRQTYRNRCEILMANKVEMLSVPVLKADKLAPYRDIKIDYGQKWLNVHLRGIRSAYGKAPFFEYFYPSFEEVFLKRKNFLWELNVELLTICLNFLFHSAKIDISAQFVPNGAEIDLRGRSGAKGRHWAWQYYTPITYHQLFGLDFVPNLSVIDLLFCEGPGSSDKLHLSLKKKLNNT